MTHFFRSKLLAFLGMIVLTQTACASNLASTAKITYEPLSELSGLVKSQQFEGVYWAHNDSGDSPRLFAIDINGQIIFPGFLRGRFHGEEAGEGTRQWPGHGVGVASHIDWEDIATDGEWLYVADFGNNGNARRDLGIYQIPEPNPRAVEQTRPLAFYPVRYPEQSTYPAERWHFDAESLFYANDTLYIITKHREAGKIRNFEPGANLYRLDTRHVNAVNDLIRVDHHPALTAATAADLSPDGRFLAVLAYQAIWLFETPAEGDQWLSGRAYKRRLSLFQVKQPESIAWIDNDTLLVGNEQRDLFTVPRADIPPVASVTP